jgi:putative lipoic acid-binding regulatory protein
MNKMEDAPRITFPCDYPIKVMGTAGDELRHTVIRIMDVHAPGYDRTSISIRDSNKGNYQSLTVTITATGHEQLQAIFEDLKQATCVKMVL